MVRSRQVEGRGDRVALVQEAGFGRVSLVSVLAGTLVSYGAFAVLLAIAAAVAKSAGVEADVSGSEWRRLGVTGGVIVAAVLLLCYLFGGYVAGRMSRRAGATNGFMVFVLGVVVAVAVTGLVNVFTDGDDILRNLRNVGVPTTGAEWRDVGTVAGIGSLLAMVVGAVLGGILGERWHGKLVARALDPTIGPEAEARAAADHHRREAREAEQRAARPTTVTPAGVPAAGDEASPRSPATGAVATGAPDAGEERDRHRQDGGLAGRHNH